MFGTSSGLAWGTNYCNEEGQILFRSQSPALGLMGQVINVLRVVPPCIDGKLEVVGDAELRDFYENIGAINYRVFNNSSIIYQNTCHPTNILFKKGGLRSGGRDRTFRGPDGREYIWKLKTRTCKLFLNDSSSAPVAKFHDKPGSLFGRSLVYLEIFCAGKHMVEWILMTFIYVEKLRGGVAARSHYNRQYWNSV